ncbi:PilW family protein [Kaarinaea lacus]
MDKTQSFYQKGLTITELMIAMAAGLIVSAAVAGLFLQSQSSYNQNDEIGYLQENGRYALRVLAEDLSMVDYFAGIQIPTVITATDADLGLTSNGCGTVAGWNYNLTTTVSYINQAATSSAVSGVYPCISNIDSNTDVLMIKRVKGQPFTTASALEANAPYLRSNKTSASLFKKDGSTTDPATGFSDWQYLVHIYYIEDKKLRRKTLSAGSPPSFSTDILAEGVEQFHVVYGIDSTGDGFADYFDSSPTDAEISNAVLARLFVLVRGSKQMAGYTNDKVFQLGDLTVAAANDGFYRRVFNTSVVLKNPQAVIQLN